MENEPSQTERVPEDLARELAHEENKSLEKMPPRPSRGRRILHPFKAGDEKYVRRHLLENAASASRRLEKRINSLSELQKDPNVQKLFESFIANLQDVDEVACQELAYMSKMSGIELSKYQIKSPYADMAYRIVGAIHSKNSLVYSERGLDYKPTSLTNLHQLCGTLAERGDVPQKLPDGLTRIKVDTPTKLGFNIIEKFEPSRIRDDSVFFGAGFSTRLPAQLDVSIATISADRPPSEETHAV